jgi:hypothetical protein
MSRSPGAGVVVVGHLVAVAVFTGLVALLIGLIALFVGLIALFAGLIVLFAGLVTLLVGVVAFVAGLLQVVFEGDDLGGGGEGVSFVEQLAHAGGEGELTAGVAAVVAGGAFRLDHPGSIEATQERGLDLQQLRGLPDRVGREVVVIELVQPMVSSPCRADRLRESLFVIAPP